MPTIYAALATQPRILARVEALLETAHAEPLVAVTIRRLDEDGQSYPLAHTLPEGTPRAFGLYMQVTRHYPDGTPGTEDRWLADFDGAMPYLRAFETGLAVARALGVPFDEDGLN